MGNPTNQLNAQLLENLAQEYGSSFYLLDSAGFVLNCRELTQAFGSIYPQFKIAYSYKTNYLPPLCKAVNKANPATARSSRIAIRIKSFFFIIQN